MRFSKGSTVTLTHRWVNMGWGYCPTNIPQWKGRFKVAFALLDKKTELPKYVFTDEQAEASEWLKGNPKDYTIFVRDIELYHGAGFITVLFGSILRMPGLPKNPNYEKIDFVNGEIVGLS